MSTDVSWSLSIVSHGHGEAISQQLDSLGKLPTAARSELIVTLNLPGETPPDLSAWPGAVRWIRNDSPQSYARNHNQALGQAAHEHLAILDPDLEWISDPFPALQELLAAPDVMLASPCVNEADGHLADHARPAPTPWSVVSRRLFRTNDGLATQAEPHPAPWLAGLFIATRRPAWDALGGFDETYRLYAEDVELGLRCWGTRGVVLRHPQVAATHHARRESKSNLTRLLWHITGLLRLWRSDTWKHFWEPATQERLRAVSRRIVAAS